MATREAARAGAFGRAFGTRALTGHETATTARRGGEDAYLSPFRLSAAVPGGVCAVASGYRSLQSVRQRLFCCFTLFRGADRQYLFCIAGGADGCGTLGAAGASQVWSRRRHQLDDARHRCRSRWSCGASAGTAFRVYLHGIYELPVDERAGTEHAAIGP